MSDQRSRDWLPGLELARALAIVLVVWAHGRRLASPESLVDPEWFAPAHWGLELFFALSGYLIVGQWLSVLTTGSLEMLRSFALKRFFRTLPTYWIILLVLLLPSPAAPKVQLWLRNAFFLDTVPLASDGLSGLLAVNWSLAVEELSYGLFVLVGFLLIVLLGGRASASRARTQAWTLMILLIVAGNLLRFAAFEHGFTVDQIKFSALLQVDALAFGGVARLIHDACPKPKASVLAACVCLVIALLPWLGFGVRFVYANGLSDPTLASQFLANAYVLSRVICATIVYVLASYSFSRWSGHAVWMRTIGEAATSSYSTYLLHHSFVLPLVAGWANRLGGFAFVAYLILSFLVGRVSYHIVERPWLVVRRRVLSALDPRPL